MDEGSSQPDGSMSSRMTRRNFLAAGFGGIASLSVPPAALSLANEIGDLRLVAHDITSPAWPVDLKPLRIGVLSDLHHGSYGAGDELLENAVKTLNSQKPDLVVLLGDYISGGLFSHKEPIEKTVRILRGLEAPKGVMTILGNHDWWFDGEAVRRAFIKQDIPVLENSSLVIEHDGARIRIAGVADLITRRPNVEEATSQVRKGEPIVLLTHHPDVFPNVPANIALTLAGHTHGGQVDIPIAGRAVVPSRYGNRYAYGHIVEDDRHLVVSGGIGTSIVPFRFNTPPEGNLITLGGAQSRLINQ
jgi:predicted MPP superfamily phosphohydrolase